ncbi:MAG: right-handed parallel beta-helix repeat-containing protein [Chloroflexota bacterium]
MSRHILVALILALTLLSSCVPKAAVTTSPTQEGPVASETPVSYSTEPTMLGITTTATAPPVIHVYAPGSIQAAVDLASAGDTVFVHQGIYDQAVKVTTSGITIRGENGSILDGSIFPTPPPLSPPPRTPAPAAGIALLPGVTGVTIENLEIRNFPGPAIVLSAPLVADPSLESPHGNTIQNNVSANCSQGILLASTYDNLIKANRLTNSRAAGIVLRESPNNRIIGNHVDGSIAAGINVASNSTGNLIQGNVILASNLDGITISNANANQVLKNQVSESGRNGVSAYSSNDTLIEVNTVTNSGRSPDPNYGDGITISNSGSARVLKNQVSTSTRNGIAVYVSNGVVVDGNTVSHTVGRPRDPDPNVNPSGGFGIILYKANGAQVSWNSVSSSTRHGIPVYSSNDTLIEMNTVSESGLGLDPSFSDGIKVENCNSSRLLNNWVSGSRGSGMGSYTSNNITIKDNAISNTGGSPNRGNGINLWKTNNAVISGNIVSGSAGHGVTLNTVADSRVEKNDVSRSALAGINSYLGKRGVLVQNKVTASGDYGIRMFGGSTSNNIEKNVVSGSGIYDLCDTSYPVANYWADNEYFTTSPPNLD